MKQKLRENLDVEIKLLRQQLKYEAEHLSPAQLTVLRRRKNRLTKELKKFPHMQKPNFQWI